MWLTREEFKSLIVLEELRQTELSGRGVEPSADSMDVSSAMEKVGRTHLHPHGRGASLKVEEVKGQRVTLSHVTMPLLQVDMLGVSLTPFLGNLRIQVNFISTSPAVTNMLCN